MKSSSKVMLLAGLAAPLGLWAGAIDANTSGNYIVAGFGGTEVFGDTDRAQQNEGTQRGLSGGIDALHFTTAKGDLTAEVDGRALVGEEDYGLDLRLRKGERWRVNVGVERSRTYYDNSSEANLRTGAFPSTQRFTFTGDDLHIDRTKIWVDGGITLPNGVDIDLRYEHNAREGDKSSTIWGTQTTSTSSARVAPSLNHIDETTDTVALTVKKDNDDLQYQVGGRWDHTRQKNTLEDAYGSNYYSRLDDVTIDVVTGSAYVKKRLNDQTTLSVGGLAVTEDSNLAGYRYFGATPGSTTSNTYTALVGGTNYKEVGANASLSWTPNKAWMIVPSFRVTDSNLDGVTAGSTTSGAGTNSLDWLELAEAIEARYRGFKDWSIVFKAESVQGKGQQIADLLNNTRDLFLDQTSVSQKYSASAYWYFRPGLSYSAQYYFKTTRNDNDELAGSQDYYFESQRFDTHDANIRVNWRPLSTLNFVTRYDFKVSTVDSRVEALPEIESSRSVSHVVSETVTWQPTEKIYVVAGASLGLGKLELPISSTAPATDYVTDSDSDYLSVTLAAGYVISKTMNVDLDATHYSADNTINNSAASVVYGLDEIYDQVGVTWTIRPTRKVAYSLRYAYAQYQEDSTSGYNDYDAHTVYAKMQYNF